MNPVDLINKNYDNFTQTEKRIADFILANVSYSASMTISTITEGSDASNAAVIRMCRKMGYEGFSEFKFSLNRYLMAGGAEELESDENNLKCMLDTYVKYINLLPNYVSENALKQMAHSILNSNFRSIWGINRTAQSARHLSNKLTRLGIYNKFTDDNIVMNDDSNILKNEDLCILFSMNGRGNPHYPQMLSNLKNGGCTTILVTMNPHIEMAKIASQTIVLPWISHDPSVNFFEDQIIVYMFIEMLLHVLVSTEKTDVSGNIPD